MKAGVLAVAAAIAGGVNAREGAMGRRHAAHQGFHERGLMVTGTASSETCGCTTIYKTITGEAQLYFPPEPTSVAATSSLEGVVSSPAASSPAASSPAGSPSAAIPSSAVQSSVAVPSPASSTPVVVPTPLATTCPTPGVYTIPATTLTLTESTTVCGATSTAIPSSGTYTVGGVTTVVSTATTVVCPYATVSTSEGVETSTILTTTYVCPSAGTYTIAPLTTVVPTSTVWVYPTPASYAPGTYTQPEVVTTVTETNVVVFCPYSSSYSTISAAATTPASVETLAPIVPTTSAAPVVSSSSVYVAPAPSSTGGDSNVIVPAISSAISVASSYIAPSSSSVVSSAVATTSSSSSSGNGGSIGSSGNQWAMTYSPYNDDGSCRAAAEVAVDIALIAAKGFQAVRIYSCDCDGLKNVGAPAKLAGLKLILGIYISSTGISGAQDQVSEIVAWGQWDLVELCVVGNEAVFAGYVTASELAGFISSTKTTFEAAGYTGKMTTTEPLNIWQANTEVLCAAVDLTGANLHPFFNADVTAEEAGSFALSQLEIADKICAGKSAINLECGWPSAGTCNGKACPGVSEQKTAIDSIMSSCGGKVALFSFTNELWKATGDFGCEQSWGAIHLF